MNLIKLFLFLGIGFVYLEANYCVQVLSTPADTKDFIVNEAKSISYEPFSNVRVEQRGSYYVLRVGDYKRYQDGQKDAYKIRRFKRDAFLRRCTLDPEKVIYSRDQRSFKENIIQDIQEDITFEEPMQEEPIEKSTPSKKPIVHYKKATELRYPQESKQTTVWEECKRCFAPVYEDEDAEDSAYEEKYQQKAYTQKKQTATENISVPYDEIEVQIEDDTNDDDKSFWSEVANDTVKNKQRNNHSNLNNTYLP